MSDHENVATALLALTVRIQKADRSREAIVDGNVTKYGRRGFRSAEDTRLQDLFGRLFDAPASVTPKKDGALCLAIMTQGLKHQLTQGWSAEEIERFALRDYASRLAPAISSEQLRAFVQKALAA